MLLRKLLLRRASVSGNLFLNHPIPESPFPSFTRCIRFNSSSQTQGPDDDFVGRQNVEEHPAATISVDRSGLYNPPEHSHEPTSESELVKHLKGIIKFRGGPISVAEYMEEVLTNPKFGFYINRDVFGTDGDFITSPEVSQMFGEMIGVWVMCLWEQMGQPAKVNLVELGPGRGTLMVDLLRGATKFKNFTASLHIHLVECSPVLQKIQHQNLKCEDEDVAGEIGQRNTVTSITASPVSWYSSLEQVPSGSPTIILAHEFYDALPVHQFQKSSRGWSEKMVDVAEDSKLRFVLSPQPTPATLYLMKRCKWAGAKEVENLNQIEICPKAIDLTHSIAQRISSDGGAALIIDYGQNGVVSDSLQAIRKHKFVNILDDPGSADLSAYVDFASIKHTAEEASGEGEAPFWEGPDELTPIGMGSRYLAMAIVNKKQGVPAPFQ
ncbi:Protein arginine methyltransferase NDUFAF7 homolog, mitochondrial [Linum perenne]